MTGESFSENEIQRMRVRFEELTRISIWDKTDEQKDELREICNILRPIDEAKIEKEILEGKREDNPADKNCDNSMWSIRKDTGKQELTEREYKIWNGSHPCDVDEEDM